MLKDYSYLHQQVRSFPDNNPEFSISLGKAFPPRPVRRCSLGPRICSTKNDRLGVTEHLNPMTLASQMHPALYSRLRL
jgi:hypothetical protein